MVPQSWYLTLSALLFGLGVLGFAARRNTLVMFMSIELMLNAANVAFVACAKGHEPVRGTVYALFVILLLNLETPPFEGLSLARGASGAAAVATLALLAWPLLRDPALEKAASPGVDLPATPANVGMALFQTHYVPFEVVSLLLLVSMVGAIHLARRPRRDEAV